MSELPKGFIHNFLDYTIRNQHMYREEIIQGIPWEKRRAAQGRSAKLMVSGNGGGIFYLWLTQDRIDWLPEAMHEGHTNTIYMEDETFLYLIIGELSLRDAFAKQLVALGGELAPYDAEEIIRVVERIIAYIFRPLYERVRAKTGTK